MTNLNAIAPIDVWLSVLGLSLNFIGAFYLAIPYFTSEEEALELFSAHPDARPHAKRYAAKMRRHGAWGLGLIALGFLFQILDIFI